MPGAIANERRDRKFITEDRAKSAGQLLNTKQIVKRGRHYFCFVEIRCWLIFKVDDFTLRTFDK